jgi:N-methylhydantoinase B
MNQGAFEPVTIRLERGSLLDPYPPHAVAAGTVETSQRIVDVIFGALAVALPDIVPAASQGTLNNVTFGARLGELDSSNRPPFAYYETIGGGIGAGPAADGGDGMHVHMSNTRNTPVEALEYAFPLRVVEYSLRQGSGGDGFHRGGDGLVRAIQFLTPVTVTLMSERREERPYGLQGGEAGERGRNYLIRGGNRGKSGELRGTQEGWSEERGAWSVKERKSGEIGGNQEGGEELSIVNGQLSIVNEEGSGVTSLPGKVTLALEAGDILRIETPGGGGWGKSATEPKE